MGLASRPAAGADGDSLTDLATRLLADLPGLVTDRVRLLALEAQRAGIAAARLLAVVVAAGVLLTTAWLAVWAGIAWGLAQWGLAWGWIALLIIVVNLGAVAYLVGMAKRLLRQVSLPATVRRLMPAPSPVPKAPSARAAPPSQADIGAPTAAGR